jgi:hypothetical protein
MSNFELLQFFSEKISSAIEKIKEKIYFINEVRILREKFYELKQLQEIKIDCKEKIKSAQHNCRSKVELNEKIKKVIREMLIELRENIFSVLESSDKIQTLFDPLFQHVFEETELKLNLEEIHREELSKAISKDEFLKIIFLQIKSNSSSEHYKELNEILLDIDEVLKITGDKEMSKMKSLISILIDKVKNPVNRKISHSYNKDNYTLVSSKSESLCSCKQNEISPCQDLSSEVNKVTFQKTPKKEVYKTVDELINYINKEDEEDSIKPKKSKKKQTKKDKKSNKDEIFLFEIEKIDKEIEEFKIYMKNNSMNAINVRKIKPVLSREWLNKIASK